MFSKIANAAQAAIDTAGVKGKGLINNMRGVEATVDEIFEAERKRFESTVTSVPKMENALKTQSNGLKLFLSDGLKIFATSVSHFSGEDMRAVHPEQFLQAVDTLIAAAEPYQNLVNVVIGNMRILDDNYKQTNRDISERDRLLLAFDSARHDLTAEQKKPTPNPAHIQSLQQAFDKQKQLYQSTNEVVFNQLVYLNNNRTIHDDYTKLTAELANFFQQFADLIGPLATQIAQAPAPVVVTPIKLPPASATGPSSGSPTPVTPARAPPPIPAPVAATKQARAMYPFKAEQPSELALNPGDIVTVTNSSHPDWWTGTVDNRSGDFPAAYVSLI